MCANRASPESPCVCGEGVHVFPSHEKVRYTCTCCILDIYTCTSYVLPMDFLLIFYGNHLHYILRGLPDQVMSFVRRLYTYSSMMSVVVAYSSGGGGVMEEVVRRGRSRFDSRFCYYFYGWCIDRSIDRRQQRRKIKHVSCAVAFSLLLERSGMTSEWWMDGWMSVILYYSVCIVCW